jgi:hypothetical protein
VNAQEPEVLTRENSRTCPHHITGHIYNCPVCSIDRMKAERDRYRKALDEIAGIGSTTAILNANEGLHRARTIAISAIK